MTDEIPTHISVLKNEILKHLLTTEIKTIFDGTTGLGGHAEAILSNFKNINNYIACDLDTDHLQFSNNRLKKWEKITHFKHSNFSEIKKIIQKFDFCIPLVILLDLGLCSTHVDNPKKGFTFAKNTKINMSFDQNNNTKCIDLLNESTEKELSVIFREYGEEHMSHKIARKICESRTHNPITMTSDLRNIIESSVHPKQQKKTCSRIFQALRIAVNDELLHLEKALTDSFDIMQSGDRIGIISYHSLEDRIVKRFFSKKSKPITTETDHSLHTEIAPPQAKLITRKPICPSTTEITENPRSRSARLRILERL